MTLPGMSWEYAGLAIRDMRNFTNARECYAAGFRLLSPWLYNDSSAFTNAALLEQRRAELEGLGFLLGGIGNGLGGDPVEDAEHMDATIAAHRLRFFIIDCELAYTYPTGNWQAFPRLQAELRKRRPLGTFPFAVTSYGWPVGSMIWTQCNPLGFRYVAQWYSWAYQKDGHYSPGWACEYIASGAAAKDPNIGNGLRISDVRGMVEATGVEGSDLASELADVRKAKPFGLPRGLWLFPGESLGSGDLALIGAARGELFRVP